MKAAWFTSMGLNRRKKFFWKNKNCCAVVGFRAWFFKRIINNRLKEEIKTEKKLKGFIVELSKTNY